jgi:hypothetical protein
MPATGDDTSIRSFRIEIPQDAIDDLRRRLATIRWPDMETVDNSSQGVRLAKFRPLIEY